MATIQKRSKKKASGGRYKDYRKKRVYELAGTSALTSIGKDKNKKVRTHGGKYKFKLLNKDIVNIYSPKEKKYFKVKIKNILENPANRNFVRRNIMTKGAIIETEKGKARITNRPGQENVINAVLVS